VATALDYLKRSLRLLGVYAIGEEPSADEAQDGLTALNALMGTLSNTGLIYAKTLDTIALTASQASVTVGPTGTTVTPRPVRVLDQSYIVLDGVSFPLKVLTLQEYNDVAVKDSEGIPVGIWPQMDMPDATITFWPVPSQAMTLQLWSDKVLTSFPALNTDVTLPQGYDEAIPFMLAEVIAPEYQVAVPADVGRIAARSRRVLKRTNLQVPKQMLDVPGMWWGTGNWRDGA
jgi:hypothetical protein